LDISLMTLFAFSRISIFILCGFVVKKIIQVTPV
jgi:hypothetical protein